MKKIIICLLLVFLLSFSKKEKPRQTNGIEGDLTLTIYTHNGKSESEFLIKSYGHSFLSLKNNSSEPVLLNNYSLVANDEIVFGAWGINDHWGVWYDVEAHYQHYHQRYDGLTSVSIGLEMDKLTNINQFISSHDEWTFFRNCTYFAKNLWNKVADKEEKLKTFKIESPTKLDKQLKRFTTFENNKVLPVHEYAFYFNKDQMITYKLEGEQ